MGSEGALPASVLHSPLRPGCCKLPQAVDTAAVGDSCTVVESPPRAGHPSAGSHSSATATYAQHWPRPQLILLQLQRLTPERTYDVLLEPGASWRRRAFFDAPESPDLQGERQSRATPSSPASARLCHTPNSEVKAPATPRSPLSARLCRTPELRSRAGQQQLPAHTSVAEQQARAAGKTAVRPPESCRRPTAKERRQQARPPPAGAAQPTLNRGSNSSGIGSVASRASSKSSSAPSTAEPLEELHRGSRRLFTGRSSIDESLPLKQQAAHRQKGQLRELGHCMLQSMTHSFPMHVWDACEIPHPEREREQVQVQAQRQKARAAEKAANKLRSKLSPSPGDTKMQTIEYQPELQEERELLHQEHIIAWLARQTGWSVLDVEEVREIFFRYAVGAAGGRIDAHGPIFKELLGDVCSEPSREEIRAVLHLVTRARRKTERRALWQSITSAGEEETHQERTLLTFSEFYLALAKWLDQQKTSVIKRCKLLKFSSQEPSDALVDHFKDELTEAQNLLDTSSPLPPVPGSLDGSAEESREEGESGVGSVAVEEEIQDESSVSEGDDDDEDYLKEEDVGFFVPPTATASFV